MAQNEQLETAQELETKIGEIIGGHLERLAGSGFEKGNFAIDVSTLACFVLLAGHGSELKGNQLKDRFTCDDLLLEISELGISVNGNLERIIRKMEKAGYVRLREDRSLVGQKPLFQLCRLLDELFPRMPGINLVAYLIQTMDEALSGRKGMDEALEQMDQVLEMQRVPVLEKRSVPPGKEISAHFPKTRSTDQEAWVNKREKTHEEGNRRAMLKLFRAAIAEERQKAPAFSSGLIRSGKIIQKNNPGKSVGNLAESRVQDESGAEPQVDQLVCRNAEVLPGGDAILESSTKRLPVISENTEGETAPEETRVCYDPMVADGGKTRGKEQAEDQPSPAVDNRNVHGEFPAVEKGRGISSDEEIEKRVAAFEKNLAMICPLCGKGRTEMRETTKGKRFYVCSQDSCYFISWGKPYHLTCPRCRNTFLIEAVDIEGRPFLKCPRATCNYKQNLPGEDGPIQVTEAEMKMGTGAAEETSGRKPKRKVVRKRLVRKKR